MTYPLVAELAEAGIAVPVSCRVLTLARQPYYRWRNDPIRDADVLRAYRINALHDAHEDDPTFGYRYLADEARRAGWRMSRRTAWKLCSQAGILSCAQRRRRGKGKKAGPPVFDDHVQRVFRADAPEPGLAHRHHRAPHDDRRQALLLRDQRRLLKPDRGVLDQRPDDLEARGRRTPQRRRPPRRCRRMHLARRQGQPVSKPRHGPGTAPARHGRFDGPSRRRGRQRSYGELLVAPADQRTQPAAVNHPAGSAARHRRLDRAEVSPATSPGLPRRLDPRRVRVQAGRAAHPRGLNHTCHQFVPHAHTP